MLTPLLLSNPDSQEDSVVGEERGEEKGEEGESEVRRRRVSLLAALERIGRKDEEEDGEEEEFRLPQKEEESGFSLNKCILGAVILLGLGTIFFSGRSCYVTWVVMGYCRQGYLDMTFVQPLDTCMGPVWPHLCVTVNVTVRSGLFLGIGKPDKHLLGLDL